MLSWAIATVWAGECAEPVRREEIEAALAAGEKAWVDFDDAAFRDRVAELAGVLLPCAGDAMAADLAARTHVLMALHLTSIGDDANARASAAAARAAAPDRPIDPTLVPADHPLWPAFEAEPTTAHRSVPEPRSGSIAFDGVHTRDRPRDRPTIAQLFDDTGAATVTTYLGSREPLPSYAAIPRQRNALLGCSAGTAALAAVAYGLALDRRGAMYDLAADPSTPGEDIDAAHGWMNGLGVSSMVLLGASAGCGVGAARIGQR